MLNILNVRHNQPIGTKHLPNYQCDCHYHFLKQSDTQATLIKREAKRKSKLN